MAQFDAIVVFVFIGAYHSASLILHLPCCSARFTACGGDFWRFEFACPGVQLLGFFGVGWPSLNRKPQENESRPMKSASWWAALRFLLANLAKIQVNNMPESHGKPQCLPMCLRDPRAVHTLRNPAILLHEFHISESSKISGYDCDYWNYKTLRAGSTKLP